jgi:hypothetical protein
MYAKGEKIETNRHESKYQGKKIPGMRSWGGEKLFQTRI